MTDEEFFLANRAEIERAVRFVASRARLSPDDADELLSAVNLHLIEHDYAVIRKFKGACSFATYVAVIARHALADTRMQALGRFRPSAEAKRLGDAALRLEALLHREHLALEEAIPILQRHFAITREEIIAMAARLPARTARPRVVSIDDAVEPAVGAEAVEEQAIGHEHARQAAAINRIVQQTLAQFGRSDRVAFQLTWRSPPVSVANIARMLHRDQKQLYRRLDLIARHLQKALVAAGVTREEILELTDGTGHFDFGLDAAEIDGLRQPIEEKGGGAHEVPE